jgi:hypothetical protein
MLWLVPRLTIASSLDYEKLGMWLAAVPSENNGYAGGHVKNQVSILNPHMFSGRHAGA